MQEIILKSRMKSVGYTQRQAALDMNMTEQALNMKLMGKYPLKPSERFYLEHLIAEREEAFGKKEM